MTGPGGMDRGYRLGWDVLRRDWPVLLLLAVSLAAGLALYPSLPERVPSHWNLRGEVDAYGSRLWAAFGPPLLGAAVYFLMLVAPLVDPRRENYARFAGTYRLVRLAIVSFLVGLHAIVLLAGTGRPVNVAFTMQVGVSLLFILLGNVMGQVRHNYFVGIRTPWTLASEAVWVRTHRAAARAWVAAGVVGLAGAAAGPAAGYVIFMAALGAALIYSIVYSYVLFRREQAGLRAKRGSVVQQTRGILPAPINLVQEVLDEDDADDD